MKREVSMRKEVTWKRYMVYAVLFFGVFLLELLMLLGEHVLLKIDLGNMTDNEKSIHCLGTALLWILSIGGIVLHSHRSCNFPAREKAGSILPKDWTVALLCLLGCKVMTFIDWHTLKIIGEARSKDVPYLSAQYLYYIVEVILILCIIMYAQKGFTALRKKESAIPFGGIFLAITWGSLHIISGGGSDWWNVISCMIFAVLSGIMYIRLKKKWWLSYCFIAIGYLL